MLNVRGTLPVTNVSFGDGRRPGVHLLAGRCRDSPSKPQFLAGDLDDIDGTLNLDLGTGRHTLLLSDEGARLPATRTCSSPTSAAPARARDAALAASGEIFVVGPGDGGDLVAGGRDRHLRRRHPHLDERLRRHDRDRRHAHDRAGVRTTTWLNTGLGNDTVTVDLQAGQDGFFVLNTQGPNDNVLDLTRRPR